MSRMILRIVAMSCLGSLGVFAQDVVSYKELKGVQIREYQMVITIDAFDCEATVGKKCTMAITVVNKGEKPEPFNGTLFSIDDGKGNSYRAIPPEGQSAAGLKKDLQPGESAKFTVYFNGRIHFEGRNPAHLRYANTSKLRIVK